MVFVRRVEDFVCDHCHVDNRGDGYTNHCYSCLHSKHVDISPGDRLADCRGMMVPVRVELRAGIICLVHRCGSCQAERRCRISPEDDQEQIRALSARGQPPPPRPVIPAPRRPRPRKR